MANSSNSNGPLQSKQKLQVEKFALFIRIYQMYHHHIIHTLVHDTIYKLTNLITRNVIPANTEKERL